MSGTGAAMAGDDGSVGGGRIRSSGTIGSEGGGAARDRLERRYRRLLAVLPESYRAARGEEMLGALMDGAPEGRRWPKLGEALSLAALGARVRSGLQGEAPTVESAAPLARAVALTGTLFFSFLAGQTALQPRGYWSYYLSDLNYSDLDGHQHGYAQWLVVTVAGLLWPLGYAALVLGLRRTTRCLAATAGVIAVLQISGVYTLLAATAPLIVILAMVLSTRGITAREPRFERWLAGLLPVAALSLYFAKAFNPFSRLGTWVELIPMMLIGATALAVATLRARWSPAWPLAFALVETMELGQYLNHLNHLYASLYVWSWDRQRDPRLIVTVSVDLGLILIAGYAVLRQRRQAARGDVAGGTA